MPALPQRRKQHKLINVFAMGLSEHGRLGLGPPDDERMVAESGRVIGWHKPRDPAAVPPVAVSNVRARRTHVPGVARLAKIPAGLAEAALGSTGGVCLPTPLGKPLRPDGPRAMAVATGESHSLCALEDGRLFGWGNGAQVLECACAGGRWGWGVCAISAAALRASQFSLVLAPPPLLL